MWRISLARGLAKRGLGAEFADLRLKERDSKFLLAVGGLGEGQVEELAELGGQPHELYLYF